MRCERRSCVGSLEFDKLGAPPPLLSSAVAGARYFDAVGVTIAAAVETTVVPEPATRAMTGVGFAVVTSSTSA